MSHLFYCLEADFFHKELRPVLARCWAGRSFEPCRELCMELLPRIQSYHQTYHGLAEKTLVEQAIQELSFDRQIWRALVGEVLLFAAEDVPLVRVTPASLIGLLSGEINFENKVRGDFVPIQQVLFGSRDLVLGKTIYRPDHAGLNDCPDVERLAVYLQTIDPAGWQPQDLTFLPDFPDDEERAEEIAFIRQEWPALVEVFRQAANQNQVVVCEWD